MHNCTWDYSTSLKQDKIKGAGATLYPDKIVIETVNRIKNSYGLISANVTTLSPNEDLKSLGQTLRRHLDQSRDNLKDTETGEYKDYLKAAGFKNKKEHYKNALHLTIDQRKGKIFISPKINGGPTGENRGFSEPKELIVLDANVTDEELGDHLRVGWSKSL